MASKIRDKIIDHAVSCFAEFGYSGCSTKLIASKADVTEGSLFRLFSSKQKLFEEAIERVKSEALPAEKYERLLNSGDPHAAIPRALTAVFKRVSADGLRLNRFAMLESPKQAGEVIRPVYDGRIKPLAKLFRESGAMRKNIDARFAAESLYLAVLNFHCEGLFAKRSIKARFALAEKFIGLFLHGVLK
jgi:AcrR family transcriptional regulator